MNCDFRIVSEWDTTLMYMTIFASDPEFLSVFLSKTKDASKPYSIESVYPKLQFGNNTKSGKVNGWWVKINVPLRGAVIHHKTEMGFVDLSIANGAEQLSRFLSVEKWLHESGHERIVVVQTQKSATFRINVPEIHMWEPYESWNLDDFRKCLDAEMELAELADMFSTIRNMFD